jgi:hypothetical protein
MEALLAKLMLLLHGKGALALVLALSGGLAITGTVDGVPVDLKLSTVESRSCVEALFARAEARLEIEERYRDGRDLVRRLSKSAREQAEERDARIDERALSDELQRGLDELKAIRDEALTRLDEAAGGLGNCEDGDAETGAAFDLARLKQELTEIVHEAGVLSRAAIDRAQSAFDELVASATPRAPRPPDQDSDDDSEDSEDSEDSDDSED